LKDRLVSSDEWEEFNGKSGFWLTMGGLGNVDPSGSYRGLSIRAFDAKSSKWAIWWLDGRNPTHIDPPVLGVLAGDTGTFSYWRNYFTRTASTPTPLPKLVDAQKDWDFLVGSWTVRHRRLGQRLVGSNQWDEFGGTLVNWPVLGGNGNVGDNIMDFPAETVRGVGIRAYDPATRQWLSWWLDGRDPSVIAPPLRGGFANGIGAFVGDDTLNGRPIKTRVQWSRITPRSARWEQASSADGGATWETNWTSDFVRTA